MPEEALMLAEMGPHSGRHAKAVLARFPNLRVTSTRRTVRRNRAVGGSPSSFHLTGRAADFAGPVKDLAEAAAWVKRHRLGPACTGPEEVLVHNSGSGLHLHVAW